MSQKNDKVDLAWGNPYFLLETLDRHYTQKLAPFNIKGMVYAPDAGFERLVELTKQVIRDAMGLEYKHVIITHGATHAINTALRIYKKHAHDYFSDYVYTPDFGFPYYSDMIERAGFVRKNIAESNFANDDIMLIDSPNNPTGRQYTMGNDLAIWDAVYHNKIYNASPTQPYHGVMVGSYSKLLGLTGARVGWIATNNDRLASQIQDYALKDLSTLSVPSQGLIIDILQQIDLQRFMAVGGGYLNDNKEVFNEINYLFAGQNIPEVGMFHVVQTDEIAKDLFRRCQIEFIELDRETIRFSLGQTRTNMKEAVKRIIQEDKG